VDAHVHVTCQSVSQCQSHPPLHAISQSVPTISTACAAVTAASNRPANHSFHQSTKQCWAFRPPRPPPRTPSDRSINQSVLGLQAADWAATTAASNSFQSILPIPLPIVPWSVSSCTRTLPMALALASVLGLGLGLGLGLALASVSPPTSLRPSSASS